MTNIAILGFGVVGGGVAKLITDNARDVKKQGGDEVNIKYILDLRDFPGSPFEKKVVHDFSVIVNDPEVDCVIEVMGGSHPAYEYTVAALKAGKSVISSNKEVVANFGDEFMRIARESGVAYRFEAAVGGGIPVISPMISCIGHNKVKEVRGILNGTTNYILTKMFTFGESFEAALADAQAKGYAERNPDADVLGTDAARKITILASLATDRLCDVNEVHTEGITKIRSEDVKNAASLGMKIKLIGRCVCEGDGAFVMVAPFMVKDGEPLSGVSGVYNAVEVDADPLGNVMFYGQGAGAGATASAVVSDLMQIMRSGINCKMPEMKKDKALLLPFSDFRCRSYVALESVSDTDIFEQFGKVELTRAGGEVFFITEAMSESEFSEKLSAIDAQLSSRIRLL